MNKGSIVERLCSDLIAKNRDINGLLHFTFTFQFISLTKLQRETRDRRMEGGTAENKLKT